MVPPTLPQELIDEIIDQFGETALSNENRFSNKRVLASLSMVARAWKERSQIHLFSTIDFRKLSSINLTESSLNELASVFSLTKDLNIDGSREAFPQYDPAQAALFRYFHNLESLSLTDWDLTGYSPEQLSTCFGHLGETVIQLELAGRASSDSLICLTSMFPRLKGLEIAITSVHTEGGGTISREKLTTIGSFQGSLNLWGLSEEHENFLAFLSSTSPRFNTICIDYCSIGDGVGMLLNSSAASLESLELCEDYSFTGLASLSECTQLREVSIAYPYRELTASLLHTICSPHLKKFVVHFWPKSFRRSIGGMGTEVLRKTDNELRAAYDRWVKNAAGTIEVTFRMEEIDKSGYSLEDCQRALERFLPRFTGSVAVAIKYTK